MKNKFKFILILLAVALSAVCLSACDFFSYNESEVVDEETREYSNQLKEDKENYVSALNSLSSEDAYYTTEQREYKLLLIEAINQINECEDIDELEVIYNKNVLLINSVKKISHYEVEEQLKQEELAQKEQLKQEELAQAKFNAYKQNKILEIQNYVDVNDYRNEEAETVSAYIEEYKDNISNAADETTADNYVRDFKIKIYSIKTDSQLYAEELSVLKDSASSEIEEYVSISNYRENEAAVIRTMQKNFQDKISACETKESVKEFLQLFKDSIFTVKTDSVLYNEELITLINDSYLEMLEIGNTLYSDVEELKIFYNHCDDMKKEMQSFTTKEQVQAKLLGEKKSVYLVGAEQNDQYSLKKYQDILVEELSNYLDESLYRAEQITQIHKIINNAFSTLLLQNNFDDTITQYNSIQTNLSEIKTNNDMWLQEDDEFRQTLKTLYGDFVLKEPKSLTEASSYDELAEIIDYYAFYQLDGSSFVRDKFRVKLNWNHKDATWERNEVYWYCELLKSAVDIKAEFENNSDYLVLTLIPYNFAIESNASKTTSVTRYDSLIEYNSDKTNYVDRDENFDDFPYYQFSKTVTVWNSQQLWYALEQGYIPNCVPGSTAEDILNKTKAILRGIIKEGMSDEEKIFNIYMWFGKNVQYDYSQYDYGYSSDPANLPNEVISSLKSHFIEGVIDEGLAVCIGYAKAYLLMLRIEGIETRLEIGRLIITGNDISSMADYFHSYVFIKLGDKWYFSDPKNSYTGSNQEYISLLNMCLPKYLSSWMNGKICKDLIEGNDFTFYENLSYKDLSIYVKDKDELYAILEEYAKDEREGSLIILYNSTYIDCFNDLILYNENFNIYKKTYNSVSELIITKDINVS